VWLTVGYDQAIMLTEQSCLLSRKLVSVNSQSQKSVLNKTEMGWRECGDTESENGPGERDRGRLKWALVWERQMYLDAVDGIDERAWVVRRCYDNRLCCCQPAKTGNKCRSVSAVTPVWTRDKECTVAAIKQAACCTYHLTRTGFILVLEWIEYWMDV
jgi:hypothetical protein